MTDSDCFRRLAYFPKPLWEPALLELLSDPVVWYLHTEQQTHPGSAHKDTKRVYFRGPEAFTAQKVFGLSVVDYHAERSALPLTVELYRYLAVWMVSHAGLSSTGRVMAVSLKAGGCITPHVDEGHYAEYFDRVHFCLSADQPGNRFYCGGEAVEMLPGELWWFNHHKEHSVENFTGRERIHLLMDYH